MPGEKEAEQIRVQAGCKTDFVILEYRLLRVSASKRNEDEVNRVAVRKSGCFECLLLILFLPRGLGTVWNDSRDSEWLCLMLLYLE